MDKINVITIPADEWDEVKNGIGKILEALRSLTTGEAKTLLTSREVLNRLKIGRTTLNRWILNGTLEAVRLGTQKGSKIYFRSADIERLETNTPA